MRGERKGVVVAHLNFIGGKWVPAQSGVTDEVLAPATGAVIASVPSSDAADVDAAILWCMDKFNDEVSYGTKWNYAGHAVFTFADEEDAVLFALRWV